MRLGGGQLLNGDVTKGRTSQGHTFKPGTTYCFFLLKMTIKLRCWSICVMSV